MKRCVIVGAGIVGQMSALALLDRGWSGKSFLILETSAYPPASWAGGGILSPLFPWRYPSELNALCETATDRYQRLTERLQGRQLLGADVLNRSGMWMEVVSGDRDAAEQWLQDWKGAWEWQALPFGSRRLNGVFCPQLGSIRNPRLLKGLRKYLVDQGVQFVQELVRGWEPLGGGGALVRFGDQKIAAQSLILAAGAGMQSLLANSSVYPVKGEMLLYRLGGLAPSRIILTSKGYVIPRKNGDTLVGSTVRVGDATTVPTVAGRYLLERIAHELVPVTRERRADFHWAGSRPGHDSHIPLIGPVPGAPGVFAIGGHYRNGLVSAPASAELLAQLICGETPFIDPAPYSLSSRSSSSFLSR
ncbi:MAG: FAD-dependent oxidoreductase [Pseudomonadales bacterium]|nr:FAD-dependent oxidoreductase [Pseudomonadales bacterium]